MENQLDSLGRKHGFWREQSYPSGEHISYENLYEHGELCGESRIYHENGQMRFKVNFKSNKRSGLFQNFNKNGREEIRSFCVDDVEEGEELFFKY
jgi:antitoxin component YwqK of YwqJK toxin-antitoxin module